VRGGTQGGGFPDVSCPGSAGGGIDAKPGAESTGLFLQAGFKAALGSDDQCRAGIPETQDTGGADAGRNRAPA